MTGRYEPPGLLRAIRFACAAMLLVLAVPAAAAASVDDVLALLARTYGGESAPRAISQTGTTYSAARGSGPVLRAYQHPDRFRIDIRYPGGRELRVLREGQAWHQGGPMMPGYRAALILQAARMALPWNLIEGRTRLSDRGAARAPNGRALRVLELDLGEGLSLVADIDAEAGLILRSRGYSRIDGTTIEFGTVYEDFKHQDGRLYAATEHHFAMGQATGYTRIDSIEFLDRLPDKLFEPDPEAAPAGQQASLDTQEHPVRSARR